MIREKVYIAAPYTKGDVAQNVRGAVWVAEKLIELGYIPFIPHLTHLWHLVNPHSKKFWLDYDREWLKSCDMVLRLPGDSEGADEEVALAKELEIPVVSLKELVRR